MHGGKLTVRLRLLEELARLERNKERRQAREKAKGLAEATAGSPALSGSPSTVPGGKGSGTQRRCANCGQVGHIKTNKKYSFHWIRSFHPPLHSVHF